MSTTVKKYTEIYQQIKQDIESGVYKVNEKLPQGRLLAQKYQVSELTITKRSMSSCVKAMSCDAEDQEVLLKISKMEM